MGPGTVGRPSIFQPLNGVALHSLSPPTASTSQQAPMVW